MFRAPGTAWSLYAPVKGHSSPFRQLLYFVRSHTQNKRHVQPLEFSHPDYLDA